MPSGRIPGMSRPTVLLGMSGGVDSSVAAALLVRQGYDVRGVTLQVWEHEDETVAASKRWQERGCCKVGIARYVAQKLAISHEVIDTRAAFRRGVIDDFVAAYLNGTTPNPCVRCNERVKLKTLITLADDRGIDFVATGHYARILGGEDGGLAFHKALDAKKDQTYFLYRAHPSWLPRLLYPVGAMHKSDVWAQAEALGLPTDELKESQEICFVSQGDYRSFLAKEAPRANQPGTFIHIDGRPLGQHDGIAFFTPGQRRGLGVSTGHRLYVQEVIPETATVVLGPEETLQRSRCTVTDVNLFDPSLATGPTDVEVKVRYATPPVPATIHPQPTTDFFVDFHRPQRALSPGQSAVFYRGDRVLGGGVIGRFPALTP